jgi:hypothetical protein
MAAATLVRHKDVIIDVGAIGLQGAVTVLSYIWAIPTEGASIPIGHAINFGISVAANKLTGQNADAAIANALIANTAGKGISSIGKAVDKFSPVIQQVVKNATGIERVVDVMKPSHFFSITPYKVKNNSNAK